MNMVCENCTYLYSFLDPKHTLRSDLNFLSEKTLASNFCVVMESPTFEVSLLKGTDGTTRVVGVTWKSADSIPDILTRRLVLEQAMSIFDPLGFLCPFTLLAKLYLRETWSMQLGWDDALPADLHSK